MSTFEKFEQCLRDALAHLYDPVYRPPELLWEVMGYDPRQGVEAIQTALVREIESLKPAPYVPPKARIRRVYGLLSGIYVQGLTQEDTAERLDITSRHLRRERPEAVHALALRLWEQSRAEGLLVGDSVRGKEGGPPETAPANDQSSAWRSQVRRELASLQESAPGTMADVGKTIDSTIELARTLTTKRGICLEMGLVRPNLIVKIHPSVLRQILITAIGQLVQHMASGQITICAKDKERNVEITITGHPAAAHPALNGDLIREIVTSQGGSAQIGIDGDLISFWVELPSISQTVLVVDDNVDMAHLYRRYATGTRYRIVHIAQGQRVLEMVETSEPDVIVLDIMLPDVDGWELLGRLREHPASQPIPILVCSVVREQDLALALGADLYLTKPVQRHQFIQALDRLLSQVST